MTVILVLRLWSIDPRLTGAATQLVRTARALEMTNALHALRL